MATMEATSWDGQGHGLGGTEDEFQQFLDMNNMGDLSNGIQFDLQSFQANGAQHMMQHAQPRENIDTPMSGTQQQHTPLMVSNPMQVGMSGASTYASIPASVMSMSTTADTAISDLDAQIQFLQQQKMQQQQKQLGEQQAAFMMRQNAVIPPTPRSLDLQASNGHFYVRPDHTPTHAQHEMFEQFQRLKSQQEMSFTPLASPAVTPLESQFSIVDQSFAVPGAYFSPLTSPALHPQVDQALGFEQIMGGTSASPTDLGASAMGGTPPSSHESGVRPARKTATTRARSRNQVGKSPIVKPTRKKTGSTPRLSAQAFGDLSEAVEQPLISPTSMLRPKQRRKTVTSAQASNTSAASSTESENSSVSPEALSEMPPPPVPRSRAKPSPQIQPLNNNTTPQFGPVQSSRPTVPSPATPASLMRLASPSSGKTVGPNDMDAIPAEQIETLELPQPVKTSRAAKASLAPIQIASPQIHAPTDEPASATIGSFQPLPSPIFAKSPEMASPLLTPGSAATTPSSNTSRKTPQLGHRQSKKRGSISSSHVSPALRPRISPNIRPLLPGGDSAENTASLMLTSKSNYQNILEGNRVPGVSYPSELSTNLTSKRTSHKIAEQGRRNRINSALQEMATLLPGGGPKDMLGGSGSGSGKESGGEDAAGGIGGGGAEGDDGGDRKDGSNKNGGGGGSNGSATQTPSSKASTVELAIEYIKQLKEEVAEANRRAAEAEGRLKGL